MRKMHEDLFPTDHFSVLKPQKQSIKISKDKFVGRRIMKLENFERVGRVCSLQLALACWTYKSS